MDEPSTLSHSTSEKHADELANNKTAQCSVILVYQTKIVGTPRTVTLTWSKTIINHTLVVSIEKPNNDSTFTCKVELKPWPFWSKKGLKSCEIDGERVEVFWDLRSAKFTSGPEPSEGYYVALVCKEEVILLVGDLKKKAYKRTKSRPSLEDAILMSKRENVFGRRSFSARAKFDQERKKEHDIVVENSILGPKDAKMCISIDGIVLIHVTNLQWKFRGNETVLVEKVPVQIFWDVHDWLFGGPGVGHALFIFKPGLPEPVVDEEQNGQNDNSVESLAIKSNNSGATDFCFFLYAWKVE